MATKEPATWRDQYQVLKPEHGDLLDVNAANHEFRGGLSKEDAERQAHSDYLKNLAVKSAAFHYLGARAAIAANHQDAAKQHGFAYTMAMKHLGHGPLDAPPKEVLEHVKDLESNPYSFKNHEADHFFQGSPDPAPKDENARTLELIENLKAIGKKQTG
jgi:hypothetical protein